jgi:hypothetical protein
VFWVFRVFTIKATLLKLLVFRVVTITFKKFKILFLKTIGLCC